MGDNLDRMIERAGTGLELLEVFGRRNDRLKGSSTV